MNAVVPFGAGYVAVAGNRGEVGLVSLEPLALSRVLVRREQKIWSLATDSAMSKIIAGGFEGDVEVIDIGSGLTTWSTDRKGGPIRWVGLHGARGIAFSIDMSWHLVAADMASGAVLMDVPQTMAALSETADRLAVYELGCVKLLKVPDAEIVATICGGGPGPVDAFAFDQLQTHLYVATGSRVRSVNASDGQMIDEVDLEDPVPLIFQWRPWGEPIDTTVNIGRTGINEDGWGFVFIWDTATGALRKTWMRSGLMLNSIVGHEGSWLAAGEALFRWRDGKPEERMPESDGPLDAVASLGGAFVAGSRRGGLIGGLAVWPKLEERALRMPEWMVKVGGVAATKERICAAPAGTLMCAAHPDGPWEEEKSADLLVRLAASDHAVAGSNGINPVAVWDLSDGGPKWVRSIPACGGTGVDALALADADLVACAAHDRTGVFLGDSLAWMNDDGAVRDLAFTRDGALLVAVTSDRIVVRDAQTGEPKLMQDVEGLVAVVPLEKHLVGLVRRRSVEIWDIDANEMKQAIGPQTFDNANGAIDRSSGDIVLGDTTGGVTVLCRTD